VTRASYRISGVPISAVSIGVLFGAALAFIAGVFLVVAGPLATPGSAQAGCNALTAEAETATLSGDFVTESSQDASGGQYAVVPNGVGVGLDVFADTHTVEFCISVPRTSTYRIDARVQTPSTVDNSFYVSVDGGPETLWHVPIDPAFQDATVNATFDLTAGDHTVTFHKRETGSRLDRISLVDTDASCALAQEAEAATLSGAFVTDADGQVGFIGVPDGAGSSYTFSPSNPTAEFCVDVTTAGTFRIDATTLATSTVNDSFFVTVNDGPEVIWHIPNDPAPQTNSVRSPGETTPAEFTLAAGPNSIVFHLREDGTYLDRIALVPVSAAVVQAPFAANQVPGLIEAEGYDLGGPGIAYNDEDIENRGSADYRVDEQVDIWPTFGGEDFVIGGTRDGSWTEYTVDVASAGTYTIDLLLASGLATAGSIEVSVDGVVIGSTVAGPTGGWWDFENRNAGTVALTAGTHVVRTTWTGGAELNFDEFTMSLATPNDCGPLAQEAEDGELSGQFVTIDDTLANGGSYVTVPDFDLPRQAPFAGGVSEPFQGTPNDAHKVTYCVFIPTEGTYRIDARVRTNRTRDDSFFVAIDGNNYNTWDIDFGSNPDQWFIDEVTNRGQAGEAPADPILFGLSAGNHELTIFQRENGTELDSFEFVLVDRDPTAPTPTPTVAPILPTPTPFPPTPTALPNPTPFVQTDPIIVYPADVLQDVVVRAAPGSTFLLKAGVHIGDRAFPKPGMTFIGEDGAILDGNGLRISAFASGSLSGDDNVTIENLEIRNYWPGRNQGPISARNPGDETNEGKGWIVRNNNIHHNRGAGITVGRDMQIINNDIYSNGQIGITGSGSLSAPMSDVLVENNRIYNNNTTRQSYNFHSGGIKITYAERLQFLNNEVYDNWGINVHCDIRCNDVVIADNTISYDLPSGLFANIVYELSTDGVIRDNTLSTNTARSYRSINQILSVSNSDGVLVEGNEITSGNTRPFDEFVKYPEVAIAMTADDPDPSNRSTVRNNTIINVSNNPTTVSSTGFADFEGNTYRNEGVGAEMVFYDTLTGEDDNLTFAEWQAKGQDVNGQLIP